MAETKSYYKKLDALLKADDALDFDSLDAAGLAAARNDLSQADKEMAAMLSERDNLSLAKTLAPLVGETVSQKLFDIGVLGMAVSTIIILMLINGFAFCELLGVEPRGVWHRIGTFIPAIGVIGPFVWSKAAPALATPTSVAGGAMLPIAYFSFLLLMNSKSLLGDAMPTGAARIRWNVLMIIATAIASFASIWGLKGRTYEGLPIGNVALGVIAVLMVVGALSFFSKNRE